MKRAFLPLLLATPLSAAAFFDDFKGPELEPHWSFYSESGGSMDYNLSKSMLHVTRMYTPGAPGYGAFVYIAAEIPGYGDYEMIARVGWDEGEHQYLDAGVAPAIHFNIPSGGEAIWYHKRPGEPPRVGATIGLESREVPAPASGMHEFRLVKTGSIAEAYFDGNVVLRGTGSSQPGHYAFLGFAGPESGAFAPLHVDSIRVVPEPHTLGAFAIGFLLCLLRRRGRGSV